MGIKSRNAEAPMMICLRPLEFFIVLVTDIQLSGLVDKIVHKIHHNSAAEFGSKLLLYW